MQILNMARRQIVLINQALSSAISSINMARGLLQEIEHESRDVAKEMPGIIGKFDGESMLAPDGKKYPVSENYASKSQLVCGDTLKMVEENGRPFFKQIDRVKRVNTTGILAKKDGRWTVVTSDGSYNILSSAISFHQGSEGDEVSVIIPAENKRVPFAAFDRLLKEKAPKVEAKVEGEKEVKREEKPEEKKPVVKKEAEKKKEEKPKKEEKAPKVAEKSAEKPARKAPAEDDLR